MGLRGYLRDGMKHLQMKRHFPWVWNKGCPQTDEILDIVNLVEIERVWIERNKEKTNK